ncbi:MAG: hypothetical protein Q9M25_01345, partial [Mariprofundaceae bacterium]|nr:hypothetical protein [Mariprofundaceae bacterium]
MILASEQPVSIRNKDFSAMCRFVQAMWRLKQHPEYEKALKNELPAAAGIDPGAPGILMGYDFHLTDDGPKLIEINNNAGGLYMGDKHWLAQPDLAVWEEGLVRRLYRMFPEHWQRIAIMDEDVTNQFMYPE